MGHLKTLDLDCSICLDLMHNAHVLDCGHTFCEDCIVDWMRRQRTCPVCRTPIDGRPIPVQPPLDNTKGIVGAATPPRHCAGDWRHQAALVAAPLLCAFLIHMCAGGSAPLWKKH
mmetsp:Transcript_55323/g.130603  ORF Transcript_55323/g.130603 Transcript_55323/m.130603 type:complete len:115 (+) Transcript_55323:74-418(+)